MREFEEYRDVLADLKEQFPNNWISVAALARYEGCKPSTVRARYGIPKGVNGIDRPALARRMCMLVAK